MTRGIQGSGSMALFLFLTGQMSKMENGAEHFLLGLTQWEEVKCVIVHACQWVDS